MQHAGRKVEELFYAALELEGSAARSAFLDRACGDPELRRRVEELLEADPEANCLLEVPAPLPAATAPLDSRPGVEEPGTVIGPYKLRELIGEGGMGVVYVAEQTKPVRRKVALKIIKPGMDTRQVVARFEAERQALAMMDHPNIAKVHDAGATASGRPYFVMELVCGMPVTEYCDAERLSVRARLELLVLVCRAVQHAHQKGIIHRDLKPSNILVTLHDGVPVPKVIDFGVAKATGGSLTEKTVYTAFAQLVGTPLYMSPEQVEVSGLDVDTRSDIYSLGVLLYELLTGTTPFDSETLKNAAFDEMRHMIREEEPPKPSTRLSKLGATLTATAARRSADPRQLNRSVRGELDWIVMKALEKDRRRRYETANDFAADVLRYLTHKPVEACPPSAWYRFTKYARRNRAALTTATILAAVLILGTALSTWQAILARRAERDAVAAWAQESRQRNRAVDAERLARGNEEKAKRSQADTRAFSEFLVNDMLAVARPEGMEGGLGVGVTVAQALEAAEAKLAERFAGRPQAEAAARDAIGKTWRNLTRYEQAEQHLRRALELRNQELGPDDPDTLESQNSLAVLLDHMGRYAESIALYQATLEKSKARFGSDHAQTLMYTRNLASAYLNAGRLDVALPLLKETLERSKRKLGLYHRETVNGLGALARAYLTAGQFDQALPLIQETLEKTKTKLGPNHPDTLAAMNNLAVQYREAGKLDLALPLLEQALEKAKGVLGPDHFSTLIKMQYLAVVYHDLGKLDQALRLYKENLERRKAKLGPDHPHTLFAMNGLGRVHQDMENFELALPLLELSFARMQVRLGPDHPDTLAGMGNLGNAYRAAGLLCKALPLLQETLARKKEKLGFDHKSTLSTMHHLAMTYSDAGRLDEALPLLKETLQRQKAVLGADHPNTIANMNSLAVAYLEVRNLAEAEPLFLEVVAAAHRKLGNTHPDTQNYQNNLAECYDMLAQPERAEPLWRSSVAFWKAKTGEDSPKYAQQLACLGANLLEQRRPADAEPLLRVCLAIREKSHPDAWTTFNTRSELGGSLLGQKKYAEAEPLLRSGYEGLKQREQTIRATYKVRLTEALERLVQHYDAWGLKEKADDWRRKLPDAKSAKPAEKRKD
jgi:serine/threonine protein kinase/tetratricopeptide (TPR) repeat protein